MENIKLVQLKCDGKFLFSCLTVFISNIFFYFLIALKALCKL